jgi:hypothetical protein
VNISIASYRVVEVRRTDQISSVDLDSACV